MYVHRSHSCISFYSNLVQGQLLISSFGRRKYQCYPLYQSFSDYLIRVEVHLIIICGCLPTLRPLYERIVNKRSIAPSKSNSRPTYGSSTQASANKKGSFWKSSRLSSVATPESPWVNLTDRSEDKIIVESSVDIETRSARSGNGV